MAAMAEPRVHKQMSTMAATFYNAEQRELMETTKKVIEAEVNPYVDEWEAAKSFPAHKVFKVSYAPCQSDAIRGVMRHAKVTP